MKKRSKAGSERRPTRKRRSFYWAIGAFIVLAVAGLLGLRSWHQGRFDPEKHMVWIEPGTFRMGGSESETGTSEDTTRFRVTLSEGFAIGRTEVTQPLYKAVMGKNPAYFSGLRAWRYQPVAMLMGRPLPVEQVSWHDAMEFCRRLTEREREAGRLPEGHVYSLPTEAQWEYACRAGSDTRYSFGDSHGSLKEHAWYRGNSRKRTHPVARKPANPWGLYDMHGNVWEWCRDWYAAYPAGPVTDPEGPSSGRNRVNRGGGWYGSAANCQSAYRNLDDPGYRKFGAGFRVVCVPE